MIKPKYEDVGSRLFVGKSEIVLKDIPDNHYDSVVCDPPYELGFMGKSWDKSGIAFSVDFWKEVMRVMKPGAHLLAFSGTRTYHRMACAIEGAGFQIRDQIQWIYGSGFPKNMDIGKAVDKLQGNAREIIGKKIDISTGRPMSAKQAKAGNGKNINDGWDRPWRSDDKHCEDMTLLTRGTSEFEGWGTALKPANEPICMARKPLSEKTIAENVLKWGVGGLNIDDCRIGNNKRSPGYKNPGDKSCGDSWLNKSTLGIQRECDLNEGRWPANIIFDEEAGKILDMQGDVKPAEAGRVGIRGCGLSRFFYCAKISTKERNLGLGDRLAVKVNDGRKTKIDNAFQRGETLRQNTHPTVKPVSLMRHLATMVTPPGGKVLDPFIGSGSTGIACLLDGFHIDGIDMGDDNIEIAHGRMKEYKLYEDKKQKSSKKNKTTKGLKKFL